MLQDRRSLTTTETQGVEGERLKDAIMVKMLQGAAMYMITEVTERCRQCVERWQQHCSEGTVRRTEPEETAVALMGMTAEEAMSMAGDDGVYTTSGSGTGSGTGGEDDGSRKGRARREAPKRTPGGAEGARRSQRIGAHIGATASSERAAMESAQPRYASELVAAQQSGAWRIFNELERCIKHITGERFTAGRKRHGRSMFNAQRVFQPRPFKWSRDAEQERRLGMTTARVVSEAEHEDEMFHEEILGRYDIIRDQSGRCMD